MSDIDINKLNEDMIPQEYANMVKIIGIEKFISLLNAMGGTMVYIPRLETFQKKIRNSQIVKEYNGSNSKELAKKYGMSVSWIRKVIKNEGAL